MSINPYLVVLVVILIFTLVIWLVAWFRILFGFDFFRCRRTPATEEDEEPMCHRNLGFMDHEGVLGRPSTIAALMESPPSYEEALKYDQFGFPVSPPVYTELPSSLPSSRTSVTPPAQAMPTSSGEENVQLPQSAPAHVPDTRPRASTTSSACPLTPISEEEFFDDSLPITVVIDCIGVQTSRIVPNCDTKVNLAGGDSLHEHSGC